MEILLIIAVIVIISIVSAAGKKKPNQSDEDAPVRTVMSDIQKAFMMSGEMGAPARRETEPAARQTVSKPDTARPMAARQTIPKKATERLSARTFETTLDTQAGSNKYANIDLGSFRTDIDDNDMPMKVQRQQRGALSLFEDKDDFVRAVIYSEILTRKAR